MERRTRVPNSRLMRIEQVPDPAAREDQLADPDRVDRPLYAWLVEDQVCTGDLPRWCRDFVNGHYSGVLASTKVVRLHVHDGDLRGASTQVKIRKLCTDANDMMHYRAFIRDSMDSVVDAADFVVDGRA